MDRTGRFLYPQDPVPNLGMLRPDRGRHRALWSEVSDRLLFVQYARYAIYHGLLALDLPRDSEVLVPAYHCAAAIEPIRTYGARVRFYRVAADLHVDLEDLERRMSANVSAVLCIHYCGLPQRIGRLRELCDQWRVRLIEDCAHVICGTADGVPMGRSGDISVFSLRKFFPIHLGGLLAVNEAGPSEPIELHGPGLLNEMKTAKVLLEASMLNSAHGPVRRLGRVIEALKSPSSISEGKPTKSASLAGTGETDWDDVAFDRQIAGLRMSRLSRWALGRQDIRRIVEARRQNYATLIEELSEVGGIEFPSSTLPGDACPLYCPVIVNDAAGYDKLLRSRGIPATTWSQVVHPLLPRSEFPEADRLYRELIFLPVHQDLNQDQMRMTARRFRDAVGDRRCS